MKNKFLPFVFLLSAYSAYSQVGVGTLEPNPSSQLEVVATNKGVLIPRIELKSAADVSTIANGNVNSLLIFNTAKTSDVTPGYYYWYDNKWNKILVSGEVNLSEGTVVFNPVTNEFTYTNAGGVEEKIDFSTIIGANETKTTITNNNNGTYTYNAEAGTYTIDVLGDVQNNFQSIIDNTSVKNILKSFVTKVEGSVSFDATKNEFTYVDASGATQVINIGDLIKNSETKTTLVSNNDGTYTYNAEGNAVFTIDVLGDVANNFQTIVDNSSVQTILNTFISKAEGNVTYDTVNNQFTYVDASGNKQVVDISDLVKNGETKTTLVNNNDGTYTYNAEGNAVFTIDVLGDVANNFQTIVDNSSVQTILNSFISKVEGNVSYDAVNNQFTYVDASGNKQVVDISDLVKNGETKTTLVNNNDGTYTYNAEGNAVFTIDVLGDVANNFQIIVDNSSVQTILNTFISKAEGNVTYDTVNNQFTYVDASGNKQVVDISDLVKNGETKTTLVNNNDGTYTYNAEGNAVFTIDVIGDVANNFQTIVDNSSVQTILNTFISKAEGNVTYDAVNNQFTYVDASGNKQVVDISDLVKNGETKTTLVSNSDGTYTYNAEGNAVFTIDVIGDVANNFQTIVDNSSVQTILNTFISKAEGNVTYDTVNNQFTYVDASGNKQVVDISDLVKNGETKTTLVSNSDGTYTYNAEGNAVFTIDVLGDVANNFQTIVDNSSVQTILNTFISKAEGNVTYDTVNNQFTYVDASGNKQVVDISDLVKNGETKTTLVSNSDGTYTYNAEGNAVFTIDVLG
ncbi:hypothetical protein, partial [Flavobacterium branchiicola]